MAELIITAFDWVPDFARGLVRDLRVRWACEEVGRSYSVEKLSAMEPRPADYLQWQPFDQVPAARDGKVELFETGAILLYLALGEERLLPADKQAGWLATSWLFAALNSVEPSIIPLVIYNLLHKDKDWAVPAREAQLPLIRQKLMRVSDALGEKDWLAGQFSIADIVMVHILFGLRNTDLVEEYPVLVAYYQRGTARPAFQRALAAQIADFTGQPPVGFQN